MERCFASTTVISIGSVPFDRDEPVILVLHMACPRVEYLDRGKSSVVIES